MPYLRGRSLSSGGRKHLSRDKERERADRELEREVRRGRKFTLAEALGRKGGGIMKGASPVARLTQIELELEEYIDRRLEDSEGAAAAVLQRAVRNSETLLSKHLDDPLKGLRLIVERLLRKEELLRDFVRDADAEWGRIYGERPRFDLPGRPPQEDDPYTVESTRAMLERFREELP
jgi:hypothetical protein